MDGTLKAMLDSGKRLLVDTKQRKPTHTGAKKPNPSKDLMPTPDDGDPYKMFVKRVIADRPKKDEILKDIHRFIKVAEDAL